MCAAQLYVLRAVCMCCYYTTLVALYAAGKPRPGRRALAWVGVGGDLEGGRRGCHRHA